MCSNIRKTQSICKGHIGPKVILANMSTLLLGFQGCSESFCNLPSKDSKTLSSIASKSPNHQTVSDDVISSRKDGCSHFLGAVSYLKRDHNLGLIRLDAPSQAGVTGSKKIGLLFYAPSGLMDCSTMHLSNQGVTLSYLDSGIKELSAFIEVDGALFDKLSKKAEPLFHKDDHSRLKVTCTTDFTTLNALDYGIQSLNDAENISSENGIVLLQDSVDKERLENINYAGFMPTTCISACMSNLVKLVRHLSTNTVQSTNAICPASVCGNRLQPAASRSGDAAYGYIKHGNRYRLIPLSNSASSVKEGEDGEAMHRRVMEQVVASSPRQMSQEGVVVTAGLKKPKQIRDIEVQTEPSLSLEDYYVDNGDGEYVWDDNFGNSSYLSNHHDNNDSTADMESDTLTIGSSIFDEHSDEDVSREDSGIWSDNQKAYNDGDGQEEEAEYNPKAVKRCGEKDPIKKLYHKLSFSKRDQKKIAQLPD